MFKRTFLIICLLSAWFLTRHAFAEPYLIYGLKSYPPYSFIQNNQVTGIDVDVAKEAFRRADYKVSIALLPWKRLLTSAKNGTSDGTLGAFITEERRQYLDFIEAEPLRWIEMSLFTYSGAPIHNSTIEDLKGRKIGINRGFSINAEFDQAIQDGHIKKYSGNNIEQLLRMLAFKRLDGVVHTKDPTLFYIKELGYQTDIHMVQNSITKKRGGYMSLSKKIDETQRLKLKTALNKALVSMREDGTLARIRASYLVKNN